MFCVCTVLLCAHMQLIETSTRNSTPCSVHADILKAENGIYCVKCVFYQNCEYIVIINQSKKFRCCYVVCMVEKASLNSPLERQQ